MSSEEGWHLRRPQYTDVLRDENLLVLHIVFLHPLAGELFGVPLVDGDGDLELEFEVLDSFKDICSNINKDVDVNIDIGMNKVMGNL